MTNIALLGYGTVGTGLVELIDRNKIKNKLSNDVIISSILVKNKSKHVNKKYYNLITTDISNIFSQDIDIVIEVMGGLHPSYEYVKQALTLGKHVITANKDLISEYGKELLDLAKNRNISLNFEASVGGGIPILKPLIECLCGNDILSINAILNGTTNFILTKMFEENIDYKTALKLCQELGFAESNPDADVKGVDSARKLAILSTIAYKKQIKWSNIPIEGITNLNSVDFKYAKKNNYCIKLMAMSSSKNNKVYASVQPTFVPLTSSLSKTNNEFNSIHIEGDAVGNVTFYGKGAGMLPTASSMYGDLLDVLNNKKHIIEFSDKISSIDTNYNAENTYIIRVEVLNCELALKEIRLCFNPETIHSLFIDDKYIIFSTKLQRELLLLEQLNTLKKSIYIKNIQKFIILNNF